MEQEQEATDHRLKEKPRKWAVCCSLNWRIAFNQISAWKLHLGQTQGHFVARVSPPALCFFPLRGLTATDGTPPQQPYRNVIMSADRMYFGVCVTVDFVQILQPPELCTSTRCHLSKVAPLLPFAWLVQSRSRPGITVRCACVRVSLNHYELTKIFNDHSCIYSFVDDDSSLIFSKVRVKTQSFLFSPYFPIKASVVEFMQPWKENKGCLNGVL